MSSTPSRIVSVVLLLMLADRAGADEARTILERAIAAHGGADKLERTKRGRLKAHVERREGGNVSELAWQEVFDLPLRCRRLVEVTTGPMNFTMEYGVNGTIQWMRHGQGPLQKEKLKEPLPLESHWHAILAQLALLRRDTMLKFLGEEMKGGRRLALISAQSSRAAEDLYFDRATGLLARSVKPVLNFAAEQDAPGGAGEVVYEEYKQIQGVQYPMHSKATNPGFVLDIKITSIEFLDEIDEREFALPIVADAPQSSLPPEAPTPAKEEPPARWDMRLVVATLAVGCFVAVVWLIARNARTRKAETPPQ